MKTLFISMGLVAVLFLSVTTSVEAQKREPAACTFCGVWEYVDNGHQLQGGGTHYLKINKASGGRFKLTVGWIDQGGAVEWTDYDIRKADGIYLTMVGGRLVGRFVSGNFYATHAHDSTYAITCSLSSNGKMRYSIWFSGGGTETFVATKISN